MGDWTDYMNEDNKRKWKKMQSMPEFQFVNALTQATHDGGVWRDQSELEHLIENKAIYEADIEEDYEGESNE